MIVLVRRVAVFSALLCVMISCVTKIPEIGVAGDEPVYHLPEAGRMYIYDSDGVVVFNTRIESSFINSGSFALPPNVSTNGFTMLQSGKRLYSFSMEKTKVLVERIDNGKKTIQSDDVTKVYSPEIIDGVPVDVRYSITYRKSHDDQISWEMVLDIQIEENNMLDCGLFARVDSKINLPPMEVFLAETKFMQIPVGKLPIVSNKTDFIKLETASIPYRIVYGWDTKRELSMKYIFAKNIFVTKIYGASLYLNQNGLDVSYNRDRNIYLNPDNFLQIPMGEEHGIVTDRQVVVSEHKESKDLPFTHSLRYTAQNTLSEKIDLVIEVPVTYGDEHKTQYHFTKEPDGRPGDKLRWEFEGLESGETAVVEFTLDTDIKDVYMYHHYNYSDGGR